MVGTFDSRVQHHRYFEHDPVITILILMIILTNVSFPKTKNKIPLFYSVNINIAQKRKATYCVIVGCLILIVRKRCILWRRRRLCITVSINFLVSVITFGFQFAANTTVWIFAYENISIYHAFTYKAVQRCLYGDKKLHYLYCLVDFLRYSLLVSYPYIFCAYYIGNLYIVGLV